MSEKKHTSESEAFGKTADFEDAIEGEVLSDSTIPGRFSRRLPMVLAAVALLAVTVGLLFGYRYWVDMKQTLSQLDTALQQANQAQTGLAQRLSQAQQAVERQQQEIAEQRERLAEQHKQWLEEKAASKQSGDRFYHSLVELQTRLGGKESQWRVAEAEYLMRVANHRLSLMADPVTALEALKSADERLGATGDPGWASVRDTLAQEMTLLTALPRVDLVGISAELAALSSQVEKLPLRDEGVSLVSSPRDRLEVPPLVATDGFDIKRMFDDFLVALKSMLVIRHHERPVSAMLPPAQRYFLLQNLRLKLGAAKAALMGHNQALYADNLTEAASWVGTYFDATDAAVVGFRAQLEGLSQRQIDPELPDISGSLRALQARRRQMGLSQEVAQ